MRVRVDNARKILAKVDMLQAFDKCWSVLAGSRKRALLMGWGRASSWKREVLVHGEK